MFSFRALNESASLEKLPESPRMYRLVYRSRFYGHCRLRLRIERLADGSPRICSNCWVVEEQAVERGNLTALLHAAERFLCRELARHPELLESCQVGNSRERPMSHWWLRPLRWTRRRLLGVGSGTSDYRVAG
jgi:hypothetical protein